MDAREADATRVRARLRREGRAARRALGRREHAERSSALCSRLIAGGLLRRYRRFSAFFAGDGEVDLSGFFARVWACHKQLFLPVIPGPRLWFREYRPGAVLVENFYGIPEPRGSGADRVPLLALDVVLMPLVAFDLDGNRLGMGGGYYDRTFAWRRLRRRLHRPLLVGVGFDFQCVQRIPSKPWDVPLDGAVTDQRSVWFDPR